MSSPLITNSPINDYQFPPTDYFAKQVESNQKHHEYRTLNAPQLQTHEFNESISSIETNHSLVNSRNMSQDTLIDDVDELKRSPLNTKFHHSINLSNSPLPKGISNHLSLPNLKKQATLPIIPTRILPLSNNLNYKMQIENLNPNITIIDDEISVPDNSLIIDIRPYPEFTSSHVSNAINICLPSTLLKRATFTLQRCIDSLPPLEQEKITSFFNSPTNIYIYDTNNQSHNLYHFLIKLINYPNYRNLKIFTFAFSDFNREDKISRISSCSSGSSSSVSSPITATINNMSPINIEKCRSHSTSNLPTSTQILSNFVLPPKISSFKIRHNEELINNHISQNIFNLNIPPDFNIPQWLDTTNLNDRFQELEKLEQARLMTALTSKKNLPNTPIISSGIEFGHKNRYKDIFLYEQSRVKLNQDGNDHDYINASYINLNDTENVPQDNNMYNYIATQGPLNQTMGDFWLLTFNLNAKLIISLTEEIENGVIKCSKFWKSGIYKSSGNLIFTINVVETLELAGIILRIISITHKGETRHVLQCQLINWPDMTVCLNPRDILDLIELKSYLFQELDIQSDYPTIVHCSAGCGRTGTFCAIDTIVNILKQQETLSNDLTFRIVNNFRMQRISMVQNLRQYYLIYQLIINYLSNNDRNYQTLINLDITSSFIKLNRTDLLE